MVKFSSNCNILFARQKSLYLKAVLIGLCNTVVSILMSLYPLKYLSLTFNLLYHKKKNRVLSDKGLPRSYKLLYHHSSSLHTQVCSCNKGTLLMRERYKTKSSRKQIPQCFWASGSGSEELRRSPPFCWCPAHCQENPDMCYLLLGKN